MKVVRLSQDKVDELNRFCSEQKSCNIHQTWKWGKFQSANSGREKFWVVAVIDDGEILATALIIRMELPMNKYWLMCPRGPVCEYDNKHVFTKIVEECTAIGKEENCVYIRFEMPLELPVDAYVKNILKTTGFKKAHAHHQPENSLILDLTKSEDEILAQMKQKGRYNIKVARKKGVSIRVGNEDLDVEKFYNLVETTTTRNKFHGHGVDFYKNMLINLNGDGKSTAKATLYLAEYENNVISGIIATFYKDTGIYYFGASGNQYRNLMAPYLLQWQAIKDAKELGCTKYDFFGIAPSDAPKHPWRHITEFKKKFGGKEVSYFPAQEKVLQPFWYWAIRIMKAFRKILKG